MKNKEWAILIAVVVVIAVAASLITANITGNTIKAARGYGPSAKGVYTTDDFKNAVIKVSGEDSQPYITSCQETCGNNKCFFGNKLSAMSSYPDGLFSSVLVSCSQKTEVGLNALIPGTSQRAAGVLIACLCAP